MRLFENYFLSLSKPFCGLYIPQGQDCLFCFFIFSASCFHTGALPTDIILNIKFSEKQVMENDFGSSTDYDTSNLDHVLSSEEWEKEFNNEVLNHSSLDMKHRQMVISISNKL